MEVSANVTSQLQFPQTLNGTASVEEAGNPQSTSPMSERFSRLLGQCAGMIEATQGQTDPSANVKAQKEGEQPAVQQQLQLMQQQKLDIGSLAAEKKGGLINPKKTETDDLSSGERVQEDAENAASMDFPSAQPVVTVNPFIVVNSVKPMQEVFTAQPSRTIEVAAPAVEGKTQVGMSEERQMIGLSEQNLQKSRLQPAMTQGETQGAAIPVHSFPLPSQDGPATAITGVEPSDVQSKRAGIAAKGSGMTGNNGDNPKPGVSVDLQESGELRRASFSVEKSSDHLIPQGEGVKPLEVAGPEASVLKRAAVATPLQTEGISREPATTDTPITGETRLGAKDAVNAYRGAGGESASNDRGILSNPTAEILSSNQAAKPKLKVVNPSALSEQNTDLQAKPGLNRNDPGQVAQRVEAAIAGEAKQLLKESGVDVPGKGGKEITAGLESTAPLLQGSGETRIHGDSRLSAPANEGKLPFAEQIHRQVREKLESGDFGSNKGSITMKLHPAELGELKINLRMDAQSLKVEIVAENQSVKEALMQNLDSLKETLSRQNITMDRFNVSTDIRQGFQQGSRDGGRMMQENRGANTPFGTAVAVEESTMQKIHYGWENDNSLVSLVL